VGKVLLAGEEPQEWTALLSVMIADRPAQHWVAGLKSIEYRTLRNGALDFDTNLGAYMRERPQMLRKHDPDLLRTHLIYPDFEFNFTMVTNAVSPAVQHLNQSTCERKL